MLWRYEVGRVVLEDERVDFAMGAEPGMKRGM